MHASHRTEEVLGVSYPGPTKHPGRGLLKEEETNREIPRGLKQLKKKKKTRAEPGGESQ